MIDLTIGFLVGFSGGLILAQVFAYIGRSNRTLNERLNQKYSQKHVDSIRNFLNNECALCERAKSDINYAFNLMEKYLRKCGSLPPEGEYKEKE